MQSFYIRYENHNSIVSLRPADCRCIKRSHFTSAPLTCAHTISPFNTIRYVRWQCPFPCDAAMFNCTHSRPIADCVHSAAKWKRTRIYFCVHNRFVRTPIKKKTSLPNRRFCLVCVVVRNQFTPTPCILWIMNRLSDDNSEPLVRSPRLQPLSPPPLYIQIWTGQCSFVLRPANNLSSSNSNANTAAPQIAACPAHSSFVACHSEFLFDSAAQRNASPRFTQFFFFFFF